MPLVSSVCGYGRLLETRHVKLPLQYDGAEPRRGTEPRRGAGCSKIVAFGGALPAVQCGASADTIVLTPVYFHNVSGAHSVQIHLPHPLAGRDMVAFQATADSVLVDLVDANYLFVSIEVKLAHFLEPNLTLDNFAEWGHISVPYLFELRSQPFAMRALDPLNFLVSLKDGCLLHFQRPAVLGDFDIYNFSSSFPLFGFFRRVELVDGVSPSAMVDAVRLGTEIVVVSLGGSVVVWDLGTHLQVRTLAKIEPRRVAATLLAVSRLERDLLTVLDGHTLKSWWADTLEPLPDFPLPLPEVGSEALTTFSVQDYAIRHDGAAVCHVLWKSNTSCLVSRCTRDWAHNDEPTVEWLLPQQEPVEQPLRIFTDFSADTVEDALLVLQRRFGGDVPTHGLLRQRCAQTIAAVAPRGEVDPAALWSHLAQLCLELQKQSQEPLALLVQNGHVLVSQAHGLAVCRTAHRVEVFSSLKLPLADLLEQVTNRFSVGTYRRFAEEVGRLGSLDEDSASSYARGYLSKLVTNDEVAEMVKTLDSIPDVEAEIERTIDVKWTDTFCGSSTPGPFFKVCAVGAFQNMLALHEKTLVALLALLLLSEANSSTLRLLNRILARLGKYAVCGHIVAAQPWEPCRPDKLMLWRTVVGQFPRIAGLVAQGRFVVAFDYLVEVAFADDSLVVALLLELVGTDDVKPLLAAYSGPAKRFISGLVALASLDDFEEAFDDYSIVEELQNLNVEVEPDTEYKAFFSECQKGISQSNYYMRLSELARAQAEKVQTEDKLGVALRFAKKALEFSPSPALHKSIFKLALEVGHVDDAVAALEALAGAPELRALFTKLLKTLILRLQIASLYKHPLFARHFQLVDTILLEMANDDLLLANALRCYELLFAWRLFGCSAEAHGDRRGAIEALYLFVTRFKLEQDSIGLGAAKDDFEQFRFKVLELYLVIINSLKTLNNGERWILRHDGTRRSIVTLDRLEQERLEWLDELA